MDRSLIERLTVNALAENWTELHRLFAAEGILPPVVLWNPTRDQLVLPQHRFLLDYWRGLIREGRLPTRQELDPVAMAPALGFVMILETIEDGWNFRYRLYGSRIAEHTKRDYTGLTTADLAGPPCITAFYTSIYRALARRPVPLFTENTPAPFVHVTHWRRLILPLGDGGGAVTGYLVGNVAGEWRPPPLADEERSVPR
jgi:hypothetical protein